MTPAQEEYNRLQRVIDGMLKKYGATRAILEVRHLEPIDSVLDAVTAQEAASISKKAEDKVFITLLTLAAKGKLTLRTPEAFRKKATKADNLGDYFTKQAKELPPEEGEKAKRLTDKATRQYKRGDNLREYANRLESDPDLPPFEELYAVKQDEEEPEVEAAPVVKIKKPRKPRRPKAKIAAKTPRRRKSA